MILVEDKLLLVDQHLIPGNILRLFFFFSLNNRITMRIYWQAPIKKKIIKNK